MNVSPRLVVFDLAGTIVDDGAQIVGAFCAALQPYGVTLSKDEVARLRGTSKREAIARLLPPTPDHAERVVETYAAFRRTLLSGYETVPVTPVPGAAALFDRLRRAGTRIALNTGFDREMTAAVLAHAGWSGEMFDAVVCGDDVSAGRPAPYMIFRAMESAQVTSVHDVMAVGDTVNDLQAAFNAGMRWNVGVLSGAHDRATLEAAPHTHILPTVATIESLW